MTQEKRITIVEDRQVALQELETRFALAVRQRELLANYIKERLQPDKHFYKVGEDSENRKPSLTKEGAELICLPHNLKPSYVILSGPDNPPMDDTPYQMTVSCELRRNENFEGEGLGSASSMVTKKDGTRIQRQRDPGLRHNATLKMACKSAYIAATLNATAASEFFTQDLEDDQTGHEQPNKTKEHWCEKHNTKFFKSGKMKSYAHPVEGSDEWCHESTKTSSSPTKTPAAQAASPAQPASPTSGETAGQAEQAAPGTQTGAANPPETEEVTADRKRITDFVKTIKWSEATFKTYLADRCKSKEVTSVDQIPTDLVSGIAKELADMVSRIGS